MGEKPKFANEYYLHFEKPLSPELIDSMFDEFEYPAAFTQLLPGGVYISTQASFSQLGRYLQLWQLSNELPCAGVLLKLKAGQAPKVLQPDAGVSQASR